MTIGGGAVGGGRQGRGCLNCEGSCCLEGAQKRNVTWIVKRTVVCLEFESNNSIWCLHEHGLNDFIVRPTNEINSVGTEDAIAFAQVLDKRRCLALDDLGDARNLLGLVSLDLEPQSHALNKRVRCR